MISFQIGWILYWDVFTISDAIFIIHLCGRKSKVALYYCCNIKNRNDIKYINIM